MKRWAAFYTLGVFALAACGGGGGSNGTGGLGGLVPPTATPTPSTTTAQGTVVDDASNAPLSGVTVRLDPWATYPTPGPTPTPILTTTTDANGHFTITAANGTYLLVIGGDAVNTPPPGWTTPAPNATDTPVPGASGWRATVHDRVVLAAQSTLVAPTLVAEPLYTPPASETHGAYRLATADSLTEVPCYLAYNAMRASKSLAPTVLDEWSLENSRAIAYVGMQPTGAGQAVSFLSGGNGLVSGSANCYEGLISPAFAPSSTRYGWVQSIVNYWYGGTYLPFTAVHSGSGAENFPNDQRILSDVSALLWP